MAQDISLLGAVYPNVPAVTLPKATSGTAQFDDTSDGDAVAGDIALGKIAYANGVRLVGTNPGGGGSGDSPYDRFVHIVHYDYTNGQNEHIDYWDYDKTFSEILAASNNHESIGCIYSLGYESYSQPMGVYDLIESYSNALVFRSISFVTDYDELHVYQKFSQLTWNYYSASDSLSGEEENTFTTKDWQYYVLSYADLCNTVVLSATLTSSTYSQSITKYNLNGAASEYVVVGYNIASGNESSFTSKVTVTPGSGNNSNTFTVACASAPTASVSIDIYMTRLSS